MKIYVASSWRNDTQPNVVWELREAGHEVYDFREPREGESGFAWSDIDPDWQSWTPARYRDCLYDPIAVAGYRSDFDALKWCDAVVAVQPFGRSASLELGWAAGSGKVTILLLAPGEPELMVQMCDYICLDMTDVLEVLSSCQECGGKLEDDGTPTKCHLCCEYPSEAGSDESKHDKQERQRNENTSL